MTTADAIGPDALAEIAAEARTAPGVEDAVALLRYQARAATPTTKPTPAPTPGADGAAVAAPGTERPPADLDGGPLVVPDGAPGSLQEALRAAAELAPDKGTVYIRQDRDDDLQTYPVLLAEAERTLAGLRAAGLRPGDAALFVFDDNRGYLTAFWACVLGGFVPTPVAVASTYRSANEANRKLRNAWELLDRPVLLTDADTVAELTEVRALWGEPGVRVLTVEDLLDHPRDPDWHAAGPDTPVLNFLTSGSTGVPKCVRHTHASVTDRSLAVIQDQQLTEADVSLIWMPFDHVTVAYYNVRDVFLRCLHVNAKTAHVLGDPLLWLRWMDKYRATNTWAPNFAFAMVNELAARIPGQDWDFSRVRQFVNAGEPVVAATSRRFLELLAPYGLRPDAMAPCWGMSETCSGVTYTRQSRRDRAAGTVAVDPASMKGTIAELAADRPGAVVLSKVGRPIPGVRVRVVDDGGAVVPECRLGELQIRGRTMLSGYFGNARATSESFTDDGWFRTGDLAFVHDGELVIAGRAKDQIIVRGVNYPAHELESVVERVDGVRVTFVAAAGIREPGAESDRLAIFFVPRQWNDAELDRIGRDVRTALGREVGLAPDLLVPTTEAEFAKTANGKIQRSALADALRAGRFDDRVITVAAPPADTRLVTREWAELPSPSAADDETGVRLVLGDDSDRERLGIDGTVVSVRRGDGFGQDAPDRYRVAPADRGQLRSLLRAVIERHGRIASVVHAFPLARGGEVADRLLAITTELTALLDVLTEFDGVRLLVLTAGALWVRDGDSVDLGACALPGLIRTAVSEHPTMRVRQLDLPADDGEWAQAVRRELADRNHAGVVAARDGRRWQPKLTPLAETETVTAPVRAGGRYLVTGGLGGLAVEIAGHLLAAYGVRLLLAGRSTVDGAKADRLAELSALGDVDYVRADVADADALEAAVASAEARWGHGLDGVLHLAAADPTGQWAELERHTLANEAAATFAEQYRPKVSGTLAVAAVLDRRPDASLVLFGSVNGEFGGNSFGAYAAASCFLVGFAEYWRHERRRSVKCLAWSMWTDVGVNAGRPVEAARRRGFRAIDPDAGLRLFLDAMAAPGHYLLLGLDLANPTIVADLGPGGVHAGELLVAYAPDGVDPGVVRAAIAAGIRDAAVPVRLVALPRIPRGADGSVDTERLLLDTAPGRRRRAPAAPRSDLEREIAGVWSAALGRTAIGRDDSFFELGGNSLRATRLLALVDDRLGVRVSTQELYESPTVAGMAAAVRERRLVNSKESAR